RPEAPPTKSSPWNSVAVVNEAGALIHSKLPAIGATGRIERRRFPACCICCSASCNARFARQKTRPAEARATNTPPARRHLHFRRGRAFMDRRANIQPEQQLGKTFLELSW